MGKLGKRLINAEKAFKGKENLSVEEAVSLVKKKCCGKVWWNSWSCGKLGCRPSTCWSDGEGCLCSSKWNRENFKNYFEIFLNAPLEVVKKRDPKMIYKNYNLGKEKNIVGIDIAWHKPKNPDIEIKIKQSTSLEEIMDLILKKLTFYE